MRESPVYIRKARLVIMAPFLKLIYRSAVQLASRPLYWFAMIIMPAFLIYFLTDEMRDGLPQRAPAGIVDKDQSQLSRRVHRTLGSMQLVDIVAGYNSFDQAMEDVKSGKTYGFFFIPENYQSDLLAGRAPVITFYTNMTYYVPGTLLFKNFKTAAVYTKAGTISNVVRDATGVSQEQITSIINPVNVIARPTGNPWLNYNYYLSNGFVPAALELMIFLLTAYTICGEIKRGTSVEWMQLAGGSVIKAVTGKLLPQTVVWCAMAMAMESWLYGWNAFPMHGSWLWLTVSTLLFVLACQGFALFICCILPNLRFSLSVCALTGVLAFSLAAFSFPVESMYGAVGIFSWILPVRYYYLIYINEALDGVALYYSRFYFVAYFAFIVAPLTMIWRLKKHLLKPIYIP